MYDWKVAQRTQQVAIDPALAATGVSRADVLAAFASWNALSLKYHGIPLFAEFNGDPREADIRLTTGVYARTWVATPCTPGYEFSGANHSIIFLGPADDWRNSQLLPHELGHTLGLADYGAPAEHTPGHVGFQECGNYIGVMSYCTSPQSWFLDFVVQGLVLDGQLVQRYW